MQHAGNETGSTRDGGQRDTDDMRRAVLALTVVLASGAVACTAHGVEERTVEQPAMTFSRAAPPPEPVQAGDWPTYHHDNARTGVASQVAPLAELSRAWAARLDGAVYGQPLVLGDRVIAATENNTVYALSRADGAILWSQHIGSPELLDSLPCGNIDPLGITGTAAYDPATGLVFVVAELGGGRHRLVGVSLLDGQVGLSRPLEPPSGDHRVHQQRAALTVLDGSVYVAFGGLDGDCGQYFGSVLAAPTSGLGPVRSFVVPTPGKGGIWAPGGAVVDRDRLLFAVGNGDSTTDYDHSDSTLALSPQLNLVDSFSPSEWAADNEADLDLGSMSPAVVGDRVLAVGKRGVGYVLDARRLGGVGGQLSRLPVCRAFGGSAVDGSTVYLPCTDGTRALSVDGAGHAAVRWTASAHTDGSPVVGGGAVWALDIRGGRLHALDPASGATRASIAVGALPHFASPTLAGEFAYVGTTTGVTAIQGA